MKKSPLIFAITAICLLCSARSTLAVEFGIFSDMTYTQSNVAGKSNAFSLGAIDFYASSNINDNTRVFIEYAFEDSRTGLVTDLERLWITRRFSDEFSLGAGRFHTPLGTWNRTYHHGNILQDTVTRPFFLEFEDDASAILPTHIVGILTNGSFITGHGEFNYEAYLANGPSLDSSTGHKPDIEINTTSDPNSDKTLGFRITYAMDDMPLQLGLMYMNNNIAESASNTDTGTATGLLLFGQTLVKQSISGFDIKIDTEAFDFLLEYYSLNNDARVNNLETHTARAYFAQLGYRINESHKFIYRYAEVKGDKNDDYLNILQIANSRHHVLAYRYDIDDSNSLKFEYNINQSTDTASNRTLMLQWAFMLL